MVWSDFERFGRILDPWRDFERISRRLSGWTAPSDVEFPAVNIWISGDDAIVTAEIPGVDPNAVEISVIGDSLTIRGSRKPEELRENESYHRRERWQGQFTKPIDLPFNVDSNKVEATYARGILQIRLPRAEADKPKKITVKSA
ncbi:MAG: Hsp20/alpha crystallin family protein [Nitrospirota bacterium]